LQHPVARRLLFNVADAPSDMQYYFKTKSFWLHVLASMAIIIFCAIPWCRGPCTLPVYYGNCQWTCPIHTSYIPHTKFHTQVLYPKNLSRSEAFCDILSQAYFCTVREFSAPYPTHKLEGLPFVSYLKLLIQYICSHPPYLQAPFFIGNLRTCCGEKGLTWYGRT
jgi:hypothetical protein